ncbi:hypothetical protein PM082_000072 [Marasmius tenuissimus]|nr:hypothetical protein PM082_000072 [Marasmius tenuissimus]
MDHLNLFGDNDLPPLFPCDRWPMGSILEHLPTDTQDTPGSNSELESRLCKWIARTDQPLNVTDNPEFRELFATLCSSNPPSGQAIRRRIGQMAVTLIKNDKKIYNQIASPMTVSIGHWAPGTGQSARQSRRTTFLGITINYMGPQAQVVEKLLTFCEVGADIPSIVSAVWNTLEVYGLKHKTLFFMLDNHRQHDLIVRELQALFSAAGIPFNVRDKRLHCGRYKLYLAAQEFTRRLTSYHRPMNSMFGSEGQAPVTPATDGDVGIAINKLRKTMLYIRSGPREEWPGPMNEVSKSWKSRKLPLNQRQWFTTLEIIGEPLFAARSTLDKVHVTIDIGMEFRSDLEEFSTRCTELREY